MKKITKYLIAFLCVISVSFTAMFGGVSHYLSEVSATDTTEANPISLDGFTTISVDDFQTAEKVAMEGARYIASSSTYMLKDLDSYHKTLLTLKVQFEGTGYSSRIEFGGVGESAYFYVYPLTTTQLVLAQYGSMTTDEPFVRLYTTTASESLTVSDEFWLQISTEYKDSDGDNELDAVTYNFYFDGTLVGTKDLTNCDIKNKFGTQLKIRIEGGSPISVYGLEDEEDSGESGDKDEEDTSVCYLENFKFITTSSFVNAADSTLQMADSTRYENHADYSMRSVQGNTIDSFDNTLLSLKVNFESEGTNSRIQFAGKSQSSAFMLYTDSSGDRLVLSQPIWNSDVSMAEDPFGTFSAEKAGVTSFLNQPFNLQISFEYGNFDTDGVEDDVKLGFYFNGKLYDDTHKIIYNCDMDNFGNWITVYCDQPNGGAPVTISSIVPTNLNLTELTWSDFQKAGNNQYGADQIIPVMADANDIDIYRLNNADISGMQNTSFEAKLRFEKADASDRIYYAGISDWRGMILHARSDGNLWLQSWSGVSPDLDVNETLGVVVFDKDIAGVGTFFNKEFKLKITTEFGNYDGDTDANDVQLGFYFNDKLYNNQYLYAYDCKADFGNYISLHPGTGNMFIRSTTDEYEEVIQHLWTDGAYDVGDIETNSILVNGIMPKEDDITIAGDYLITYGGKNAKKLVLYSEEEPHPDESFDVRDLIATVKVCNGVPLDTWSGTLGVYESGMDADVVREKLLNRMDLEKSNAVSPEFIGGQDVMPIGGYCGPHRAYTDDGRGLNTLYPNYISDTYYKYIADAGVNLIAYTEEDYTYSDGDTVKQMLELGKKYGIGHFVTDSDITKRIGTSECSDVVISGGVAKITDAASLRASDSVDLDVTGEVTIFMRVKMNQLADNNGLLSKGPITGRAYALGVANTQNGWWFSTDGYEWSSTGKFPTAEWREIAAVVSYEDGDMKIAYYMSSDSTSGISADYEPTVQTDEGITGMTANTYPLYIGNYTRTGLTPIDGSREYDDIRIYNKALTAEQLANITPNETDVDEEVRNALVAYWNFEKDGTDDSELLDKATAGAKADNLSIYTADGTLYNPADITASTLQERISNYSSYDSFCGLFLVDEPTTEYYMPGSGKDNISNYKGLASVLQKNLGITCFMNMYPIWKYSSNQEKYEQYVEEYCDSLSPEFLNWDNYPFESTEGLDVYFYNMSLMREKATQYQIPFWATIQAGGHWNDSSSNIDGIIAAGDRPTKAQFNWNVNTCLAFGVQGLTYFPLIQPIHFAYAPNGEYVYDRNGMIGADGRLNDWYYYAKEINTHIQAIDKVLMNAVNHGVIVSGDSATTDTALTTNCVIESGQFRELESVTGDAMIGCFKYQGKTALYVVNYDMGNTQDITLNFTKACNVKVVQGAKTSFANTTELQVNMTAGEGALLVIE